MKKIISIFIFLTSFLISYSQHNRLADKADIANFMKSTTYVVTDDNPIIGYDIKIKTVVEKWWKIISV